MFFYVIFDEIDEKVWMIFEAPNDRAAQRIMRQNILKYQKDVDFDFSLRRLNEKVFVSILPVIIKSDDLFKSDEEIDKQEDSE